MADIRSNERSAVSLVDAGRLIAILIVIAIHTDAFVFLIVLRLVHMNA